MVSKTLVWLEEHMTPIMLGWITGSLISSLTFRFSPSILISLVFSIILIAIRLNSIGVKHERRMKELNEQWRKKRGKTNLSSL